MINSCFSQQQITQVITLFFPAINVELKHQTIEKLVVSLIWRKQERSFDVEDEIEMMNNIFVKAMVGYWSSVLDQRTPSKWKVNSSVLHQKDPPHGK